MACAHFFIYSVAKGQMPSQALRMTGTVQEMEIMSSSRFEPSSTLLLRV